MERDVRFCTTDDGVRIAYSVEGDGPDMVCCPEFIGSFTLDHLIEDQMGYWRALWRGRRVIRYDMRGTGLSQRDVDDVSHAALVRDLDAVVQASGARDFTLWGTTLGGPRAVAHAAANPAVRRLVLHRTFANAGQLMSPERVRSFADLARVNWPTAAQVFADMPVREEFPEAGINQAKLYVQSTSGDLVARMLLEGFESTDVRALLPRLRMPVLVMHRREDPMIPFALAQQLAAAIPGARLMPSQEGIMTALAAGRINEVLTAVNEFIDDGVITAASAPPHPHTRSVQTLLFTDLVGHTTMMQRLGDDAGRAVLREHERLTRETLARHGGAEIKAMGDGFMAAFTSVSAATECAIELQRVFSARDGEPLNVRVGLNAGEPIEEDGDLFGSMVILASRIAARANAGEILISDTMRGLLSGKKFLLADRGEVVMKGFEDPVRLYEVRWHE